jgi:hypothetical protein
MFQSLPQSISEVRDRIRDAVTSVDEDVLLDDTASTWVSSRIERENQIEHLRTKNECWANAMGQFVFQYVT